VVVGVVVVHDKHISSRSEVLCDLESFLSVVVLAILTIIGQMYQWDLVITDGRGTLPSMAVDDVISGLVGHIKHDASGGDGEGRSNTFFEGRSFLRDASWFWLNKTHDPVINMDGSESLNIEGISGVCFNGDLHHGEGHLEDHNIIEDSKSNLSAHEGVVAVEDVEFGVIVSVGCTICYSYLCNLSSVLSASVLKYKHVFSSFRKNNLV
jgi:hypothetical protein